MRPVISGHLGRRDFIRVGALHFLGISLGEFLAFEAARGASPGKAQACILLWLDGGASHIDMWDPKPASLFRPISTNVPGLRISELFPKLARHMDKISAIRSIYSLENDHVAGHHYAMTGHKPNPAMKFPSLGSIISKELGVRNQIPPYVMMPSLTGPYDEVFKAQILGGAWDPMILAGGEEAPEGEVRVEIKDLKVPDLSLPNELAAARLDDRRGFLEIVDRAYRERAEVAEFADMDAYSEQAYRMILAPQVRRAFDLSQENEKTKEAYGRNGFGQSVLLARRLVEAGSRFVTACGYKTASWDTHNQHNTKLRDRLAPPLDQAVSALLVDLKDRGLLDSTVVAVMSEFGRTPSINSNGGRDHWPHCWSMLLGGGGIAGGAVVGASDERGAAVAGRQVSIGDIHATLYKAMGIDWNKEIMHPIGRPLFIANGLNDQPGVPIRELVG
ncbi:MAG: DUF1501 domain-containing protein [Bryobacteraceae bacterium]